MVQPTRGGGLSSLCFVSRKRLASLNFWMQLAQLFKMINSTNQATFPPILGGQECISLPNKVHVHNRNAIRSVHMHFVLQYKRVIDDLWLGKKSLYFDFLTFRYIPSYLKKQHQTRHGRKVTSARAKLFPRCHSSVLNLTTQEKNPSGKRRRGRAYASRCVKFWVRVVKKMIFL